MDSDLSLEIRGFNLKICYMRILIYVKNSGADIISRKRAFILLYQLWRKSSRSRAEKFGRALVLSIIGYRQSKLLYRSKALY